MNRTRLCIIVLLAAGIVGGTMTAFAPGGSKSEITYSQWSGTKPESPQYESFSNDTFLKGPERPIMFPWNVSLRESQISVPKGGSRNMTVTIFSAESVNLSFSMDLTNLPNCLLPAGIDARLDKLEMSIKAGSKIALNLILSIDSQAPSGTYDLGVEIDQRFGDYVAGQCLPLRLIIP